MANRTYKPLLIETVKTSVNLEQHRFVGFDGNYSAAGAKAFGIVDVSTDKNQYAPVSVFGILLVEAGGTIAIGDPIASDENGKAVKAADAALINGYALDAGTSGQHIRIIRGI